MSGVRVAVDTSIAVAILNSHPVAVSHFQAETGVAIPSVAAGEIRFGVASSQRYLVLASADGHFSYCSGLITENWLLPASG